MSNLISMNQVNNDAIALGSVTSYTPFKRAWDADPAITEVVVSVRQGNKRVVSYVPKDVGEAFAQRFAAANPKNPPITKPAVELPLEPDDRLTRIEALVVANHNRLINLEQQVMKLVSMWETLEDDQK